MSAANYMRAMAGSSTLPQDYRNKYNTLTPAEAKKLTRYMNGKRPTRTASVLNKPRAPPLIVEQHGLQQRAIPSSQPIDIETSQYGTMPSPIKGGSLRRLYNTSRCASSCSNGSAQDQRHSMNYGRATSNQAAAASRRYAFANGSADHNRQAARNSPHDSESNLSFRSSLDIVDSAYGSDRLQTMSVDLGNPSQQYYGTLQRNAYQNTPTSNHFDYLQDSTKLSDESYSSAKSQQSDSCKLKNAGKSSLSSSTTKVFRDQFSSIKRFFRNMPIRASTTGNSHEQQKHSNTVHNKSTSDQQSLSAYISDLCLNRSQSPPVCPPPPGELKSMSYMESSVNYSNYDEFTRLRNERTSALLNNSNRVKHGTTATNEMCVDNGSIADDSDQDSWQMTSLPVAYERNLTTVIEERNGGLEHSKNSNGDLMSNAFKHRPTAEEPLIKPPKDFVDKNYATDSGHEFTGMSHTSSNQSLTSITTTDSVLDFHRQTATSFRFSYAQPAAFTNGQAQNNAASLPPRMPTYETPMKTLDSNGVNNQNHNGRVSNNCDYKTIDQKSASLCDDTAEYGAVSCLDNDGDATILSDTSTLHGDSSNMIYINKCAELERTIESLKNKLVGKEKELTDLQLKQWSSDYLIDQLKSTISRLEKENAQLKNNVMVNVNRVNL